MDICSLRNTFLFVANSRLGLDRDRESHATGTMRSGTRRRSPRPGVAKSSLQRFASSLTREPSLECHHWLEAFADVFRGESFCRMRTRRRPDVGTAMSLPSTISLDVILRP
jgi:hypothetical protein